jgi:hypothetical protein
MLGTIPTFPNFFDFSSIGRNFAKFKKMVIPSFIAQGYSMFSSLGGDDTRLPKSSKRDTDDEFHLDDLTYEEIFGTSISDTSSLNEILDRYPVFPEETHQLEGEAKAEATSALFRKSAIREKKLANWTRDQCTPMLKKYEDCILAPGWKIPFFYCVPAFFDYHHCLSVASVRIKQVHTDLNNPQMSQQSCY